MAHPGGGGVTPPRFGALPGARGGCPRLALILPWVLMPSLVTGSDPAGTAASLQITQTLTRGTEVTAYVAMRDESGAPVAAETLGQVTATLGTQVAEVAPATPFATTGEGVLYILLVDLSRSLDQAQFERIRQALRDWIAALGEQDRAAILTFGNQVRTLVAPTADRAALTSALDGLKPTDDHTALHQALVQGLTLGRQQAADLPSRRALVILSDGQDDAPGGMTAEEVEMQMAEGAVPIYALGFSRLRDRAAREAGLAALGRLARRSGGLFIDVSASDTGSAFAAMRERIRAVERLHIRCATCVADGNRYRLQLALTQDGRTLSDGVDVRLYPPATAAPTPAAPEAGNPANPEAGSGGEAAGEQAASEPPGAATPSSAEAPPAGTAPDTPSQTEAAPVPATEAPLGAPLAVLMARWPWLLGALGLSLGLVLLILGVRRRSRSAASSPPISVPEAQPLPETPTTPTPPLPTGLGPSTRRPAAPAGPTLTLAFRGGRRRGEVARLVLAPDGVIGRNGACTLPLVGDEEVSARHARLFVQDRRLLVEDLGSTNGTWLNGVRLLAPTPLRVGDVLRLGQTELGLAGIGEAPG